MTLIMFWQQAANKSITALILFKSVLLIFGVVVAGCDRKNTADSAQGSSSAVPASPAPAATTIQVDGSIDKWLNKTAAWDNGPAPADKPPEVVHVAKVFFDNDERYLYAFVQCSPTMRDRYKVTQNSGDIGDIFVDPENNPDTGSPAESGGKNADKRGYKVKVYLSIGVFSGTAGGGSFVGYDLFRFTGQNLGDNNGFNAEIPNSSQDSMHANGLIAAGKDGVEMAIPLEMLGLKPGATARIMITPSGPSPGSGFTKYHFH